MRETKVVTNLVQWIWVKHHDDNTWLTVRALVNRFSHQRISDKN